MAANNMQPCPFASRCALADENCSQEMSVTCDVITNTTPPPAKEWNPDELVAVTMTAEQWQSATLWLQYAVDWNKARALWWRECCADKRAGAETAARYEASMRKAETLCKIIEEAIYGQV